MIATRGNLKLAAAPRHPNMHNDANPHALLPCFPSFLRQLEIVFTFKLAGVQYILILTLVSLWLLCEGIERRRTSSHGTSGDRDNRMASRSISGTEPSVLVLGGAGGLHLVDVVVVGHIVVDGRVVNGMVVGGLLGGMHGGPMRTTTSQ